MLDYWMEKEGKRQIFIIFFKARPILLIVMRAKDATNVGRSEIKIKWFLTKKNF